MKDEHGNTEIKDRLEKMIAEPEEYRNFSMISLYGFQVWRTQLINRLVESSKIVHGLEIDGPNWHTDLDERGLKSEAIQSAILLDIQPIKKPGVTKKEITESLRKHQDYQTLKLLNRIEAEGIAGD